MIKLSGAIMVITACSIAGFILAERLTERSRLLRVWLSLLNILQTEIGYQSELLPEVFSRAAVIIKDRKMAVMLSKMEEKLKYGSDQNIFQIWSEHLKEQEVEGLAADDAAVLQEFGSYLGSTDREDQLMRIKVCRARLEQNLEAADSDKMRLVKVYRYLGFAIGATLVCFLL